MTRIEILHKVVIYREIIRMKKVWEMDIGSLRLVVLLRAYCVNRIFTISIVVTRSGKVEM